jgi:hypothetical protein
VTGFLRQAQARPEEPFSDSGAACSGPEKRVEHGGFFNAMDLDATLRQRDREARRIVVLLCPGLHGLKGMNQTLPAQRRSSA